MVYKRATGKGWQFQARTRHGWKPLTFRGTKPKAARLAEIWDELAQQERAWDVLDPILAAPRKDRQRLLGQLLDLWTETRQSLGELRRRLHDPNLEPYVAQWHKVYRQTTPKSAAKQLTRVRHFFPEGETRLASVVTTDWLTKRLYDYGGKSNTVRGVHSALSVFMDYLTTVHHLYAVSPMLTVPKPSAPLPTVQFFEQDAVERIVGYQGSLILRSFYAIAYGTGIESGVILGLTRADVWDESREIRAAGTKTSTRDRVAIVADWAWPWIECHIESLLPTSRLFPTDWRADQVSKWHAETLRQLDLPHLKLHNARHHWAVTRLRAGVPVAVVQQQLGHSTPVLTLRTYGAFIPTGQDRARWEAQTTADSARRSAGRSAKAKEGNA